MCCKWFHALNERDAKKSCDEETNTSYISCCARRQCLLHKFLSAIKSMPRQSPPSDTETVSLHMSLTVSGVQMPAAASHCCVGIVWVHINPQNKQQKQNNKLVFELWNQVYLQLNIYRERKKTHCNCVRLKETKFWIAEVCSMKPLHGNSNYVVALNVDSEVLSDVSIYYFCLFDVSRSYRYSNYKLRNSRYPDWPAVAWEFLALFFFCCSGSFF